MTQRPSTPAISAALLLALACMAWPRAGRAATVSAPADNGVAAKARAGQPQTTTDALAEVQDAFRAGRTGEAMRRIDVLIASRPTDARLRFQKGVMLVDQKRGGEAILVFQKLMRDYPALPEPMNNLAVLYVERGELEQARLTLEAAIRSKPNYGTAFQNLGDLYTRMASRAYARALQIDDAEGAPKLALIRQLYEPPQFDGDGAALLAQAQTAALAMPVLAAAPAPTSAPVAKAVTGVPPTAVPAAASSSAANVSAPTRPTPAPNAKSPPVVVAALPASTSPVAPAAATPVAPQPAVSTVPAGAAPAPGSVTSPVAGSAVAVGSLPGKAVVTAGAASAARAGTPAATAVASAGVGTAVPAPAKPLKPVPASAPAAAPSSSDVADVNAALRAWAGAWSRRDMAAYLGAYVPGFKGGDASADAWQAARRARILGKSSIRVDVSAVKVEVDRGVAQASFRQAYAAGGLEVNSRKTLEFARVNGRWLIRRESVGG